MIINIKGSETAVNTTPSDFGFATCVRVVGSANAVVTIKDTSNNTLGTATVLQNTVEYFEKSPSDTIEANVAILGAAVGFTVS